MRRRRTVSDSAPPVQQPAAVAAPAAPPIQPEVLPAQTSPAQTGQPALPSVPAALAAWDPGLLDVFGYREPETPIPSGGDGLRAARIGFITGRGSYAGDIAQALPGNPLGTPFLLTPDSKYYGLAGLVVMQLDQFTYWGATDDTYSLLWASLTPQGRKAQVTINGEARRITECMLVAHLILPGAAALPGDLAPGIVAVTHFRGATTSAPAELERRVADTTRSEWAQTGSNGALAALPPRMRIVATIQGESKPVRGQNRNYTATRAICTPTGAAQMAALAAWGQTQECQAELEDALAFFDEEREAITKIAAQSVAQAGA